MAQRRNCSSRADGLGGEPALDGRRGGAVGDDVDDQCKPAAGPRRHSTGPAAFQRQAGTGAGGDHDVGVRWGTRRDRRVPVQTAPGSSSVPIRDTAGWVTGVIGRDTTGAPGAPKYRNPTRTPAFEKSAALYRPALPPVHPGATVVVVEGALDALAVAAAAADVGRADRFAPCTTSGVTVSAQQARAVLSLTAAPPVIALDGDTAGTEGTDRWVHRLCVEMRRAVLVTRLASGVDPADWVAEHGPTGLNAFNPAPRQQPRPRRAPGAAGLGPDPHRPLRRTGRRCEAGPGWSRRCSPSLT